MYNPAPTRKSCRVIHIESMNIRLTIFQKFMCDATRHNPFDLGLTYVNKVRNDLSLIDKTSLLYQWLYDILCVMLSFSFLSGLC